MVYGDPGDDSGEDEMVETQDDATHLNGAAGVWKQVGELLLVAQAHNDQRYDRMDERFDRLEVRFDRLETRFDGLDTRVGRLESDVADLKVAQAATNERLDRMELANEQRANRIDAQFERLAGLIATQETRPPKSRPNQS